MNIRKFKKTTRKIMWEVGPTGCGSEGLPGIVKRKRPPKWGKKERAFVDKHGLIEIERKNHVNAWRLSSIEVLGEDPELDYGTEADANPAWLGTMKGRSWKDFKIVWFCDCKAYVLEHKKCGKRFVLCEHKPYKDDQLCKCVTQQEPGEVIESCVN